MVRYTLGIKSSFIFAMYGCTLLENFTAATETSENLTPCFVWHNIDAYSHPRQLNQLVIKFSLVLMDDITTPMAMSNQDTELPPAQHLSSPRVWSFVHNILLIPQIGYTLLRRYGSV